MRLITLFVILVLNYPTLACSKRVPENTSDTSHYGPDISDPAKVTTNYYAAIAHLAARAFAQFPEATPEEQHVIYWIGSELFSTVMLTGPIHISQEKMHWYENAVIRALSTPKAKQKAKNLPRPWPIWSPPIIWGAPAPPLPKDIGQRL